MISKGIPKGLQPALKAVEEGDAPVVNWRKKQQFLSARLAAHEAGRSGDVERGQSAREAARQATGENKPAYRDTKQLVRAHKFHSWQRKNGIVSKSKIPGGPWKPATELTNAERILVRRGKPHTPVPVEAEETVKNNLPRYALHNGQRKRVLGYHSKDRFVLLNRDDSRQIAHRNSVTIVKNAMGVHDTRYTK